MTLRALMVLFMAAAWIGGTAWGQTADPTKPYVVDRDTIALYHLDDVASGKAVNAVANGRAGVVKGALSTLGRFDRAMTVNGVKGWIDVDDLAPTEGVSAMTVECWVKFYGAPGGDILVRNSQYMMRVGGTLTAYFGIDGGWRTVSGTKALPTGEWTHLAMTYDQRTKKVSIYVNGELDVSETPKGVTAGKINPGADMLRIGGKTWKETEGLLNGAIDELRISSVARTYKPIHPVEKVTVPGNTNLVANPGFESGMYGWMEGGEVNANLLWDVKTGDAPQGRRYLHAVQARRNILMSYPFRIARGETVTVSALMRGEKPCKGHLGLKSTGGPSDSERRNSDSFDLTTEWKRVSMRVNVGADWPTDLAFVEVGTGETAQVDVDAVCVVVGNASAYTETEAQSIGVLVTLPKQSTYMLKSRSRMPVEVVDVGARNGTPRLALAYRITDWQGRTVKSETVNWLKGEIAIPDERVGWFEITFVVKAGDKVLKETSRIYNVIEPMKGVGDAMSSPLGMNTHMEREPDEHLDCNLGMLSLCGVKWIRAWWGWGMAEKQPGQFNWEEYDRQYNAVKRAGMEVMPILLRYYKQWEQAWAGSVEKKSEAFPYRTDQWGSYVKTTVGRYKGRIRYWEVWNEPHLAPEAADGKVYGELLKATYENAKAANPEAVVIGGGGVVPAYIRTLCNAGYGKYMDAISYHSYGQLGRPFEEMEVMAEEDEAVRKQYRTPKRVWHTEQGTQSDGMGFMPSSQSEKDCAVNLTQGYLSALGSGVERFFWFSAQTSVRYGWAVYYESYIPRPRLIALNGLARMLKDRKVTGRIELAGGKVACIPMDGKGGPAVALWNTMEMVKLELPTGLNVEVLDMLANPLEGGTPGALVLTRGEPVFVAAKGGSLKQLTDTLKKAKVDDSIPVEIAGQGIAGGGVLLTVRNLGDRPIDLRLWVSGGGVKDNTQIADLAAGAVKEVKLSGERRAAGEEAVRVSVEAGGYKVREATREVKVKF